LAALEPLSDDALLKILTEPKNSLIKQYMKMFALDGVDLTFDEEALTAIVKKAKALGTGARGLRSVMEGVMLDIMFDVHSKPDVAACNITEDAVKKGMAPIFISRKASA